MAPREPKAVNIRLMAMNAVCACSNASNASNASSKFYDLLFGEKRFLCEVGRATANEPVDALVLPQTSNRLSQSFSHATTLSHGPGFR
jgi:hypothetical protein